MLKERFEVSIQALLVRLRKLSIINDSHYRHWFKEIGRLGWRKDEPNALEPERPQWMQLAVLRATSEGSISDEAATQYKFFL